MNFHAYTAAPAEYTGEVPIASFGKEFGGRNDFTFRDWQFSGNLDAPVRLPSGSTTNRNFDQVPAATNFIR